MELMHAEKLRKQQQELERAQIDIVSLHTSILRLLKQPYATLT